MLHLGGLFMDGLCNWSNAIQQMTGTRDMELPDLSICHESDDDNDDAIALEKLKQQNKELLDMVEKEEAVEEMVNYFAEKICKEFNQPDFVKAWQLYKETYSVE